MEEGGSHEDLNEILIKEIENLDARAAAVLKEAGFQTDSQIQTVTQDKLQELFPEQTDLHLRETIFEIIQKSSHLPQKEHKGIMEFAIWIFWPIGRFFYGFLLWTLGFGIRIVWPIGRFLYGLLQRSPGFIAERFSINNEPASVKYNMVVCGETFDAHRQLLDQIQTPDLNLIKEEDEESCITIVFCPVTSRIGTDAEAAMRMVPGDGPVILVFMHYCQIPEHVSSSKVLDSNPNVVLEVHIFYHDKQNGLLRCEQNKNVVIQLKKKLMNYGRSHCSGSNNKNQSNRRDILY